MIMILSCHWLRTVYTSIILWHHRFAAVMRVMMMMASTQPQKRFCMMCVLFSAASIGLITARGTQTDRLRFKTDLVGMRNSAHSILVKWCETNCVEQALCSTDLCELWVIRCMALFRKTERLWENCLIAKTTFPSPRCDMSCSRLGEQLCVSFGLLCCASWF